MDSNTSALTHFFERVVVDLKAEASAKDQKIPVDSLRFEVDETTGNFYAADYFKYILFGRGPGKAPPVDAMRAWVEKNPDKLEQAKQVYKYITANSLAYIIGQKIARVGTDIFTGKKQPIDFLGVLEKNTPELLEVLARNEVISIATSLRSAIK